MKAEFIHIDPKDYFEWSIASLRSLSDMDFTKVIRKPLSEMTDFKYIQAKVYLGENIALPSLTGPQTITLKNSNTLNVDLVFGALGNVLNADDMKRNFSTSVNERGQIKVDEYLQVPEVQNVFAHWRHQQCPWVKLSATAKQQAAHLAENISRLLSGKSLKNLNHYHKP